MFTKIAKAAALTGGIALLAGCVEDSYYQEVNPPRQHRPYVSASVAPPSTTTSYYQPQQQVAAPTGGPIVVSSGAVIPPSTTAY